MIHLIKPFLLGFILSACCPVRSIVIKPARNISSYIKIYAPKDFLDGTFNRGNRSFVLVNSMDTVWALKKSFVYGAGKWSPELVKTLSFTIDSILIYHHGKFHSYNNPSSLETYLIKHRKGLMKQQIVISVH